MKNKSDEALIKEYGEGNLDAFSTLYSRHKGGVYRYLLRQIKDNSTAEDIFQEVWSAVIRSARDYKESAKFTTWLYTLARNKIIDRARHLKVVEEASYLNIDDNASENHDEGELSLTRQQQKAALQQCLGSLAPVQLDCFLLKEEGNLSVRDVAKVVEVSSEAAKSRIRYAYKNLRACLQNKLGSALS